MSKTEKPEPGTVRMNIVLPAELESRFREAIYERKGMKKGNISEAFSEAVQLWLKSDAGAASIHARK